MVTPIRQKGKILFLEADFTIDRKNGQGLQAHGCSQKKDQCKPRAKIQEHMQEVTTFCNHMVLDGH